MVISCKRYRKIKRTAEECLNQFLTRNPLKILKILNIPFGFIKLNGVDGFAMANQNGVPYVCISEKYKDDEYCSRIIAAHELGHILLHISNGLENGPNLFDEDSTSFVEEYEADVFLMELMPRIQPYGIDYTELSPKELRGYIHSQLND